MITVSIKQLLESIEEADVFRMPDMSEGTDYIYNKLYKRILHGEDVRLSQINWDRFELCDIDSMRGLYSNVLETNEYKADSLANSLQKISPVVTTAAFV